MQTNSASVPLVFTGECARVLVTTARAGHEGEQMVGIVHIPLPQLPLPFPHTELWPVPLSGPLYVTTGGDPTFTDPQGDE
ncbi:hypothetical protein BaRGS_00034843 [Batillaria attramentaria]|uniref:Uncharacterized protein n=1 Tax=Batillaria attramentaria TaxID=370345 RepID=A0ABD0JGH7_9CAEN